MKLTKALFDDLPNHRSGNLPLFLPFQAWLSRLKQAPPRLATLNSGQGAAMPARTAPATPRRTLAGAINRRPSDIRAGFPLGR
jgi:hypothetical protein